jgi:hypothetical protein
MSQDKSVADKVVEATADAAADVTDGTVETVTVAKEWLDELETRLARAERSTVTKVKDAVVSHKRQLVLAGGTVLALGAAAYAVTHREELFEGAEKAVEVTAETAELGAQDVKKSVRKARTGSTTK